MIRKRRKNRSKESGVSIIENLVAISLVGLAMVGSTNLFITTYKTNSAARNFTSLAADSQGLIDQYRQNYSWALLEFGTGATSIANGQSTTVAVNSEASRSTITLTLTAIKSRAGTIPEAIRVKASGVQRTSSTTTATYEFETIIAQVGS